ncbi:MAG: oligosaccharide flippase family protein [Acidobacteriaceae bacterium]
MNWRLAKNAFANLCRGGAAAVTAMLLPPILIRHMPASSYAVWVLALQAAAYLGYLDFGLQTAVGRYVAFAAEKKDEKTRDAVFSAAVAGLSLAAVLGVLVVLGIAIASHRIFPAVPPALLGPLRWTMVIVGFAGAVSLPASAWSGVAAGIQRYEIPAIAIGSGKLVAAAGLITAAVTGQSLTIMACILGGTNLCSYGAQFIMVRRAAPNVRFRPELISRSIIRELFGYCASLTVWSFSMLLVSGFDVLLVGRFQFSAVAPYSVSVTLIAFLAGIQTSIFGVIMPHAAALHARENPAALGQLLVRTTKIGVLFLLLSGLPLIVLAHPIMGLWIGSQFAKSGGRILAILVAANMVRLTCVPYASILVATGQQRLVIVSPLVEGLSNLATSIFFGMRYGAVGVAWGTMFGAVVGVMAHILYNLPRTGRCVATTRAHFFQKGFIVPLLCGIPAAIAFLAAMRFKALNRNFIMLSLFVSCAASVIVLFSTVRTYRRTESHL